MATALCEHYFAMGYIFHTFRKNLLYLLKKRAMTQRQFAERIGFELSYTNQLLNGARRFNEDIIEKVCEVLGVNPSQLFEGTAPLPPELQRINDLFQNVPEYQAHILNNHYLGLKAWESKISEYETSKKK